MKNTFLFAVIAAVFAATPVFSAAIDTYWIGGEGGSESEPFDIYQAGCWDRNVLPSQNYHLNFQVSTLTYLTNSYASATSTRIADALRFNSGEFVVLGPFRFYSFYRRLDAPYAVSIVKKGDWWLDWFFRPCEAANSKAVLTNEYGNMTVSQSSTSVFCKRQRCAVRCGEQSGQLDFFREW